LTPLERFEKSVFFYCDIAIDLCQPHWDSSVNYTSVGWVFVICITHTPARKVRQAPFLLFPSNCAGFSV